MWLNILHHKMGVPKVFLGVGGKEFPCVYSDKVPQKLVAPFFQLQELTSNLTIYALKLYRQLSLSVKTLSLYWKNSCHFICVPCPYSYFQVCGMCGSSSVAIDISHLPCWT